MNEQGVAKYIKKKDSSTSKSKYKSKHKHKYIDCLLIEKDRPYRSKVCEICGKIGDVIFFETKEYGLHSRIMMTDEEVFEKYKDLKQIEVNDIWDKYVNIKRE